MRFIVHWVGPASLSRLALLWSGAAPMLCCTATPDATTDSDAEGQAAAAVGTMDGTDGEATSGAGALGGNGGAISDDDAGGAAGPAMGGQVSAGKGGMASGGSAGNPGVGGAGQGGDTTGDSGAGTGNTTSAGNGGDAGASSQEPAIGSPYAFGHLPLNLSRAQVEGSWQYWKDTYVERCDSGAARVIWDEPENTVSEGIAYGMLGAVGHGDRDLFDAFWQYYTENLDPNGLMHWKRGGCEGTPPDENSNNAASDAELDAAMALIQAECRWNEPAYGEAADALIDAILAFETTTEQGLNLLKPGDVFGGADCQNPSYFAPGYYRVFAERPAQTDRRDFWLKLASDSYVLLSRAAHPDTGLVPNWMDANGITDEDGPPGCSWYSDAHIFGSDAIRTPWRIATDYVWFGTAEAREFLEPITTFAQAEGIETIGRKYELDGTPFGEIEHSIISVGAFASGAMASDQTTLDAFTAAAQAADDHRYFPDSLRVLYFLLLSGQFHHCEE